MAHGEEMSWCMAGKCRGRDYMANNTTSTLYDVHCTVPYECECYSANIYNVLYTMYDVHLIMYRVHCTFDVMQP